MKPIIIRKSFYKPRPIKRRGRQGVSHKSSVLQIQLQLALVLIKSGAGREWAIKLYWPNKRQKLDHTV